MGWLLHVLRRLGATPVAPQNGGQARAAAASDSSAQGVWQQLERLKSQCAAADDELRRLDDYHARLRAELWQTGRQRLRASLALGWLQAAQWARQRSQRWLGTRVAGACLVTGGLFLLVLVATASLAVALASVPSVLALACCLLYWPQDERLAAAAVRWQDRLARCCQHADALRRKAAQLRQQRQALQDRRHELQRQLRAARQSVQYQAECLLHSGWRHLRGYEFEAFLARAFRLHGLHVKLLGGSGDQGVDLIVQDHGVTVAIQAKGYEHAVSNDAVQQVFTGKQYYGCGACLVITNSRFTKSAREAAARVGCGLVDGDELPALVRGQKMLRDFLSAAG